MIIFNKILHLFKPKSFLINLSVKMLKIFLPPGQIRRKKEWRGNFLAQSDPIWEDRVVKIAYMPFGFYMPIGRPANKKDFKYIRRFLRERYNLVKKNNDYIEGRDLVNRKFLNTLSKDKNFRLKLDQLYLLIEDVPFPKSSSHGDFHIGNVLFLENKLMLIDWGFYKEDSTIIIDIIHLEIRYLCALKDISWTAAIFNTDMNWSYLQDVSKVDESKLQVLYALDRIDREIDQYSRLEDHKVNKYIKLIEDLHTNLTINSIIEFV